MDHGWLDIKGRQNHKGEVIVCGDHHQLTGIAGIFIWGSTQGAACINGTSHYRRDKDASILRGADCDIKVVVLRIVERFIKVQSHNNAAGLIFNGGDAGGVHFQIFVVIGAGGVGAVCIRGHISAIRIIKTACDGVTHAETC